MHNTCKLISAITATILASTAAFAAVTITTTSKTFAKEGGAASVSTGGSGTWTATTAASWITLNRASGDAGVSCVYVVSANYSADTRSATIDIAGNTYTVTQTGYTATISPASATADYTGGNGTISVTVDAGVSWTARANVDWLSVTPASGLSNGSVTYTISPYSSGTTTRTGSITIAGQTFTVSQTGTDVTISPTSATRDYAAGVIEVEVSALSTTSWTITPQASWISVVDSGYGYGNSTIMVAVGENPSVATRTGTVKIGSKTFTITQKGMTNPVLSITPTEATASPVGAYGNIAVYATPDATWSSESLSDWITISEGATGAGNGNIKYIATANPTLSSRIGQIQIIPPVYNPEKEVDIGHVMAFENSQNDGATGTRQLSKTPSKSYDGSFANTLSGDPLPKQDDNAFSVSVTFKISSISSIHRILRLFSSHAIYVNADNFLCFDDVVTTFPITANRTYTIVLTQDNEGTIKLYAGTTSTAATLCASVAKAIIHNFKAGTTSVQDAFQLGYSTIPSEGFLDGGTITGLSFWQRVLNEQEVQQYVSSYSFNNVSSRSVYETAPLAAPNSILATHFRCSGNGNYTVTGGSDNKLHSVQDCSLTVTGWSPFKGRTGLSQRAMRSDGTGRIAFSNVNKIFSEGTYVLNNGKELNASTGNYEYSRYYQNFGRLEEWFWPYPISFSGPLNATYNFWIYVETMPTGQAVIMKRSRVSGQAENYNALNSSKIVNDFYNDNESLQLKVSNSGCLIVEQNGSSTTISPNPIVPRKWTMITLVGQSKNSISVYRDGIKSGSISTGLSFGYFPPTDARCYYLYADTGKTQMLGQIVPTVQDLSIGGWKGAIDEFTIYHNALSSAQVKALYDAGKPLDYFHTVTQGVIEPSVSLSTISFTAAGGSTNVQLTVAANTQWTATSGASWIMVTSSASSAGSARVSFDVAANPSTEPRTGTLTLAGKTVTVTQAGLWSQLTYDGTVFHETSDSGFIDVQVEGNGTWTASTDASWLTLLDDGGRGSGSVMFVVDDFNTTVASRTAAVTIAGKTIYITQRGYQLSIDPAVAEIGSNAGAGEIGISAPIGAIWEAIVTADWITLVGGSTGSGSGTLRYTVADNTTGGTRTGKIVISGQEYTVTQLCSLKLETATEGEGTVAGAGNYDTNARATLTATPAAGYAFTHWSGDAVGVEPTVSFTMDTSKKVTAHFIPESAAQRLAEEKAAQGGFYTRDQIHAMELGNVLFDVDSTTGKARIGVKLMETSDLVHPNWKPVNVSAQDLDIGADGSVGIKAPATGNAKFFKVISGGE